MSSAGRQLAYAVLGECQCEDCGEGYDYNNLKISSSGIEDFRAEYICRSCGLTQIAEISIGSNEIVVNIKSEDGTLLQTKRSDIEFLQKKTHKLEPYMEEFYHLNDVIQILSTNFDRVGEVEDSLPDVAKNGLGKSLTEIENKTPQGPVIVDLSRTEVMKYIQVELHNYLSAAYTFDQILESARPKMEWDGEVESEFRKYVDKKKVVLGLRHYTQHRALPELEFKLNKGDSERKADLLTKLALVQEMDYDDGSEYYYEDVEGPHINISQHLAEHHLQSLEFALELFGNGIDVNKDEIEEYESHTTSGIDL